MLHCIGYTPEDREQPIEDVPRIRGSFPHDGLTARASDVLVVFLMSLAFLLFNISSPKYEVFDEQLYILGAKALIHEQPDYNSEHPPLGKYLIGAGMDGGRRPAWLACNARNLWVIAHGCSVFVDVKARPSGCVDGRCADCYQRFLVCDVAHGDAIHL
jgi:hypothetical protein